MKIDSHEQLDLLCLVAYEIKKKEEFREDLGCDTWRRLGHEEDVLRLNGLLKKIQEARFVYAD